LDVQHENFGYTKTSVWVKNQANSIATWIDIKVEDIELNYPRVKDRANLPVIIISSLEECAD
jgi:hypothetical protein